MPMPLRGPGPGRHFGQILVTASYSPTSFVRLKLRSKPKNVTIRLVARVVDHPCSIREMGPWDAKGPGDLRGGRRGHEERDDQSRARAAMDISVATGRPLRGWRAHLVTPLTAQAATGWRVRLTATSMVRPILGPRRPAVRAPCQRGLTLQCGPPRLGSARVFATVRRDGELSLHVKRLAIIVTGSTPMMYVCTGGYSGRSSASRSSCSLSCSSDGSSERSRGATQ